MSEHLVRFERTRNLSLAYKASAIGHYATGANHERVLIGSTHNSTSTSESILPLAITVVYTPLLKELRFHPQYNTLASDCAVRHIRDCDTFHHHFVTRVTYASIDPEELNPAAAFHPIR